MNKKFITLCVSALLAGGMTSPAFAQVSPSNWIKGGEALSINTWGDMSKWDVDLFEDGVYYRIGLNDNASPNPQYTDYTLQATKADVSAEMVSNDVSAYNLWRVEKVKSNGVNTGAFKLVNMAGLYLGVEDDGTVKANGKYQEFITATNNVHSLQLYKAPAALSGMYLCYDGGEITYTKNSSNAPDCEITFYVPAVDELDITELNDKFLSSFTIGVGYYEKDEWKDYAVEHDLQGNVFAGDLKASDKIGTDYIWKQKLNQTSGITNEVYLWNGDKIVVLTNSKWSGLNNSLAGTGYKFTLMTPEELAIQESADAAESDASKHVIRSYVFKVTSPNAMVDEALEVAAKVYDYKNQKYTGWEELYVSEVNDNYYLTTAVAANNDQAPTTGQTDTRRYFQKADYANGTNQVYVRFTDNNFVDAEHFFSYAWNIVRTNDNKAMNPLTTNEWVDKAEVGTTVPEGQWILRENDNKDGYIWVNRETKKEADAAFAFNRLRVTEDANIYRIGEGADAKYYSITKAKNAAGEEINLDAWDEFDYYGAGVKANSMGVDNTYKIQFVSELTGDPIYISMNGVGTLGLTNDPTEAVNFEVDTVKTIDKAVIVNEETDRNAYNDVFRIFNTYIGKNDKNEWVDKTDTVSFYRYNFMLDGKYLHFDADNNKYELVAPKVENGVVTNSGDFDAFVIKEKGDNYVNILNVDNDDYDKFIKNDGQQYTNILGTDADKKLYVAGNLLLTYEGSNDNYTPAQMMYFDFNFKEARQQVNIYDWNANAQLQLDDNDYNIYRNVAPTAPDTMAIYRTEYSDEFLFEKNGFLGMTVDDRGYNAALFIDTAYVRNNTEKPLFMIGLRPEITPETVYCPIHGVDAGCAHEHLDTIPGYVDADYLTVLADSSAFHAAELDNKFLANKAYTKLSFVAARHNVDTITVAADGNKTTISQNVQHPMVFAFRIVDQTTKDFIIEGVDLTNNKAPLSAGNPYKTSWMRWNNGVPVMTDIMEDAEVFNIAGDLENANPTANETIEAEATVSVVATDGAVIVKGAEGKNVIVSTILGKVVANEVVNSDNETIAAPAGIVVVSVDGESFKVAVK